MSTSFICVECGTVYEVPTPSYVCDNPACPGKGLTGLLIPNKKPASSPQPQIRKIKEIKPIPVFGKGIRPFSFKGRIRRREFGITIIIYFLSLGLIAFVADMLDKPGTRSFILPAILLILIPVFWFYFAQAAKRMHDLNMSARNLFIPIYITWLLFREGTKGKNAYGEDPKRQPELVQLNPEIGARKKEISIKPPAVSEEPEVTQSAPAASSEFKAERTQPVTAPEIAIEKKINYKVPFLISAFIIVILVAGWLFYRSSSKAKKDKTQNGLVVLNLTSPGGMPYQVYRRPGDTVQKIYEENILKLNVVTKIKDSVYYSSSEYRPEYMPVNTAGQPFDLSKIWTNLQVGDSIIVIGVVDNELARKSPSLGRIGDSIRFYFKILASFTSDMEAKSDEKKLYDELQAKEKKADSELLLKEKNEIEKYLAGNNISTEQTPSGAYIEIINPGTGNLIDSGTQISVNYTGRSFDGKIFDSNVQSGYQTKEPMVMIAGEGKMIRGFDEAILMMRPGSSVRVYIPAMLAFGASHDRGVKPYENLIFDISIVGVSD